MPDSGDARCQTQAVTTASPCFLPGAPCPTEASKKPTSSWNFSCLNLPPNWTQSLPWCTSMMRPAGLPSTALPSAGWAAANPAASTWRPCLLMERLMSCENVSLWRRRSLCTHASLNAADELTVNCYFQFIYMKIYMKCEHFGLWGTERRSRYM